MKKIINVILACLIAFGCIGVVSCSNNKNNQNDKLSVVCTIFPEYDWVKEILGENMNNVELTLLIDNSVDLHSYQPSVQDIATISACDMFIYVGGESDSWVDNALKTVTNKNLKVINLLESLGDKAKTEEPIEGAENGHDHDHEHEEELDEHVWLSLKNAEILCKKIVSELSGIDGKNAAVYQKNFSVYKEKLTALDNDYLSAVCAAKYKTLVFGDRFPFRYLADDYNLKYYAAFSGCSAETEASFETIVFLAGKVDELSLPAVCTIEGAKHKIAQTVRDNTSAKNQKILTFDSMQSVSSKDIKNGVSYLSVMENNLKTLKIALGLN